MREWNHQISTHHSPNWNKPFGYHPTSYRLISTTFCAALGLHLNCRKMRHIECNDSQKNCLQFWSYESRQINGTATVRSHITHYNFLFQLQCRNIVVVSTRYAHISLMHAKRESALKTAIYVSVSISELINLADFMLIQSLHSTAVKTSNLPSMLMGRNEQLIYIS